MKNAGIFTANGEKNKFQEKQQEPYTFGRNLIIKVVLTCVRFAHAVELSGDADGDSFGWVFADNYFDLLPGESRFVAVLRGQKGRVRARTAYDPGFAECVFASEG